MRNLLISFLFFSASAFGQKSLTVDGTVLIQPDLQNILSKEGRTAGGCTTDTAFTWNGILNTSISANNGFGSALKWGRAFYVTKYSISSNKGFLGQWAASSSITGSSYNLDATVPPGGGISEYSNPFWIRFDDGGPALTVSTVEGGFRPSQKQWLKTCWNGYELADDPNLKAKHVLSVIGTSISEGVNALGSGDYLYTTQFRNFLSDSLGYDIRLADFSKGGTTSAQWDAKRVKRWGFPAKDPSIFIYEMGTNDFAAGIAPSTTVSNMLKWVRTKQHKWPNAIMLVLPPIPNSNASIEANNALIRSGFASSISTLNDVRVRYIPTIGTLWNATTQAATYQVGDGTHPNQAGYSLMINAITSFWVTNNLSQYLVR